MCLSHVFLEAIPKKDFHQNNIRGNEMKNIFGGLVCRLSMEKRIGWSCVEAKESSGGVW